MSASLKEEAFWACAEGEEAEERRQVPIVEALVTVAETQVRRIVGPSYPCQILTVQLAPDATAVEPLGTVTVQVDDVSLVFNRAHGSYGSQPGQVQLASREEGGWKVVGEPIEGLADLGRQLRTTGVPDTRAATRPRPVERTAEPDTRYLGLIREM
jgi:hypothetical protein